MTEEIIERIERYHVIMAAICPLAYCDFEVGWAALYFLPCFAKLGCLQQ
jgi:hypothetical protein